MSCDSSSLDPLTKRKFEFIEAEVDNDIEEAMKASLVATIRVKCDAKDLLVDLEENGFTDARVLETNDHTFFINKRDNIEWMEEEKYALRLVRPKSMTIRDFVHNDLVISRVSLLRCTGLPAHAWLEDNLEAFTKHLGEWVDWAYQDEKLLSIHDSVITMTTRLPLGIKEKMVVLVGGNKYDIFFEEILSKEGYVDRKSIHGDELQMGHNLDFENSSTQDISNVAKETISETIGTVVQESVSFNNSQEVGVEVPKEILQAEFTKDSNVFRDKVSKSSLSSAESEEGNEEGSDSNWGMNFNCDSSQNTETKCSTWSKEAVNYLWNHSDNEWVERSQGTENWLECDIRSLMDGGSFYVFNIYSPQHIHQKRQLWDLLQNMVALLGHESLCFVGDFNSIRDEFEGENCDYRRIDMQFFNQLIENNNLLDIAISNS
ncbi:hypothetical protein POM88_000022 [Heracleum sosnowskyi]|uniref:Endonuclease/exonuclease/phosphatase domain-containing protein n=1 Tax=Heracleum sosnowskyi TaxID=360622 RepID=A0AAD8J9V4_9APIA|nr:hypothetical protein POM88_000022 [Heracleum sosnowskyi]